MRAGNAGFDTWQSAFPRRVTRTTLPSSSFASHGKIGLGHAIALRDELRAAARHHAVREQPALADIEDDITGRRLVVATTADQQHVVRP